MQSPHNTSADHTRLILQRIIVFSCIWTFGVSSSSDRSQEDFAVWFKEYFGKVAQLEPSIFPPLWGSASDGAEKDAMDVFSYNLMSSHSYNETVETAQCNWRRWNADFSMEDVALASIEESVTAKSPYIAANSSFDLPLDYSTEHAGVTDAVFRSHLMSLSQVTRP